MIKLNGKVVPRRTIIPLLITELHSSVEVKKRETFDNLIRRTLGSSMFKPSKEEEEVKEDFIGFEDKREEPRVMPEIETPVVSEGKPMCQQLDYDKSMNTGVEFQLNESFQLVKVKGRSVGTDGKVHGH